MLEGALGTAGAVLVASSVLPGVKAESPVEPDALARDLQARADQLAADADPREDGQELCAFLNGGFGNGGGFRKGAFGNGGGFRNNAFRNGGFANGGFRNGGFGNGGFRNSVWRN
jgi:hypothetical protein